MRFFDIFVVSFKNLFRQKARTFLTIVSMMVGAFLISIMLSVGNGLENFMVSQVTMFSNKKTVGVQKEFDFSSTFGAAFGGVEEFEEEEEITDETGEGMNEADGLEGAEVPLPEGELPAEWSTEETEDGENEVQSPLMESMLSVEDLEKIREVEHVEEAAFESIAQPDYIRLNDEESKKLKVTLYGVPIGIREDLSFSVVDEDLLDKDDTVVLSDGYAEEWEIDRENLVGEKVWARVSQTGSVSMMGMPGSASTAGEDVETKEFSMTIAGFVEKSLLSATGFTSPETINVLNAYISEETVEEYEKDERAFEIIVIVDEEKNVLAVDKAIEDLEYQSMTYEETIGQIGAIFNIINAILSSFGVIAMLVASIGIANTLLMAIYERTREIGVMKAVGATRGNIGLLFTVEAAWLGLLGGVIGLGVSWLIGRAANWILHNGISIGSFTLVDGYLSEYPTFDISIFTPSMVAIVLVITTTVAVVAGMYPAWRASRLDPIDALRHD